jgi:aryl-alcohol dehydrogenase-like predicted oxidoreductase
VEAVQPPYHVFRRGIEAGLLPDAAAHHIGVLACGPLARGLPGGTITEATTFGPATGGRTARRSPGPGSGAISKSSRR